jgi:hypothetical protein
MYNYNEQDISCSQEKGKKHTLVNKESTSELI